MQAIVQTRYGPPAEVLELRDIEKPSPRKGQVLVKVHAASLHPDVWHVVTGRPTMIRFMGAGIFKPRNPVPGIDMAGIVESLGDGSVRFEPGDEVYGEIVKGHQWHNGGAFAEYVAVDEDRLRAKPDSLTLEQAAAIPTSGLLALQGINHEGKVQPGERILINGAGGAVGTLAVQIAKSIGATVTAVDRAEKLSSLVALGADHVIDYSREDFTQNGQRYDVIVDIPGNRSFGDLKLALVEGGRYVLIGHDDFGRAGGRFFGSAVGRLLKLTATAPFGRPRGLEPSVQTDDPLEYLTSLAEAGELAPFVDRTFPLAETAQALGYLEQGRAAGKVLISM